jgi:hypothetical protein
MVVYLPVLVPSIDVSSGSWSLKLRLKGWMAEKFVGAADVVA